MWDVVHESKIPPKSRKTATPGIQMPRLLTFVCGTDGRRRGKPAYSLVAVGRRLTFGDFM